MNFIICYLFDTADCNGLNDHSLENKEQCHCRNPVSYTHLRNQHFHQLHFCYPQILRSLPQHLWCKMCIRDRYIGFTLAVQPMITPSCSSFSILADTDGDDRKTCAAISFSGVRANRGLPSSNAVIPSCKFHARAFVYGTGRIKGWSGYRCV